MKRQLSIALLLPLIIALTASAAPAAPSADTILDGRTLEYKVGFLGIPNSHFPFSVPVSVPWTRETVGQLKALGFNTVQLNVAWGARPGDEPLNIEDVVQLSPELEQQFPQVVPLRGQPGAEAREKRRADLRQRIKLCREAGLRTIFHFGAPYNAHFRYGDGPPNCLMDDKVARRYELLLDVFAKEFPGVDDILVYTYDQDAWLCNEFGPCPRCLGIPLHDRLPPFLNSLAARWRTHSPQGRLWWEPWELSAGQALTCAERVQPEGFGLALHANIAEVMSTLAVDRWLKNTATIARQRGIPVIVEYFLGGPSEELETYYHLAHPLVTLRGLKSIAAVPGVVGIKEYFGLNPQPEDANLRMTSLFFANPAVSEEAALQTLAQPYDKAAADIIAFWKLTSEGMELFPWETTWYMRQIGRGHTDHSLSAAFLRGQPPHTPSWFSTRQSIFMRKDNAQPDPWMLEDVQLRCQLAADRWEGALALGQKCLKDIPPSLAADFAKTLADLGGIRRHALAYVFHLRETNLATILRKAAELKLPRPQKSVDELLALLQADLENHRAEMAALPAGEKPVAWEEMNQAIALLSQNPDALLQKFFKPDPDQASKGRNSATSR
ncbi:MAG: hypothetical protein NTZ16_05820 [Verrucomicrobia bacterium]|nr:hypothetical protein [Verrucomicrobiota bacterium]